MSSLIQKVVLLSGGSAAAQALAFAFVPVLSRLYLPADYGYLGIVAAASTILASLVGLQFSQALMLSRQVEEQSAILMASGLALIVQLIVLAGLLALMQYAAPIPWLSEMVRQFGWAILAMAVLAASNSALLAWTTSHRRYRGTAALALARTAAICGWQFALAGPAELHGLVVGALLGELTALLGGAAWFGLGANRLPLLIPDLASVLAVFGRFRHVLIFGTSREMLHAATMTAPVLAIGALFGQTVVGHFAMASRLLDAPTNLIGSAVRTVSMQAFKAGEDHPSTRSRQLGRWLGILALPGLPMFVVVLLGADWGVRMLLGPGWEQTALYLKILALWKMIAFCKAPAWAYLCATARDADTFFYQSMGALAMMLVLVACAWFGMPDAYVVFWVSVVGLGIDLSYIGMSLRLAAQDGLAVASMRSA